MAEQFYSLGIEAARGADYHGRMSASQREEILRIHKEASEIVARAEKELEGIAP